MAHVVAHDPVAFPNVVDTSDESNESTALLGIAARRASRASLVAFQMPCDGKEEDVEEPTVSVHKTRGASMHSARLAGVTSFNFFHGLLCATCPMFLIPQEALVHMPHRTAMFQMVAMVIIGVTNLFTPAVGRLSDLTPASTFCGRRGVWMLVGAVLFYIGLCWMASLSASSPLMDRHALQAMGHGGLPDELEQEVKAWFGVPSIEAVVPPSAAPLSFFGALAVAMLGVNCICASAFALVPDMCDESASTAASGMIAIHGFLGAVSASMLERVLAGYGHRWLYALYFVVFSACLVITAASCARVPPRHSLLDDTDAQEGEEGSEDPPVGVWSRLCYECNCVVKPLRQSSDFRKVFISRTFYYMAISCQAYLLFFVRDMVNPGSPVAVQEIFATILLIAQLVAGVCCSPCAVMSNVWGRKKLVYAACVGMGITYVLFLTAPFLPFDSPPGADVNGGWMAAMTDHPRRTLMYGASGIYGLANGCFLSVDYALALDTLPHRNTQAATALGVWGIAVFAGFTSGGAVGGLLLEVFGSPPDATAPTVDDPLHVLLAKVRKYCDELVGGDGHAEKAEKEVKEAEHVAARPTPPPDTITHFSHVGYTVLLLTGVAYLVMAGAFVAGIERVQ